MTGLVPGSTVVVTETKVPDGYVLNPTPQTIIVKVAKTSCEVVIYTAIFGCTDVPYTNTAPTQENGNMGGEGQDAPEDGPAGSNPPEDTSQADGDTVTDTAAPSGGAAALSIAGCAGGIAALLAAAYWGYEKIKERRSAT